MGFTIFPTFTESQATAVKCLRGRHAELLFENEIMLVVITLTCYQMTNFWSRVKVTTNEMSVI